MFKVPDFDVWQVIYTAIGVAVFWMKWGRTKLRAYALSDLIEIFCKGKLATIMEFAVFILLGCLVGIGVAQPQNAAQALTAGFGWTGFFSTHRTTHRKS